MNPDPHDDETHGAVALAAPLPPAPESTTMSPETLGQLVACIGRVVSRTETLLWRLTVLRLVTAADESRFVESAAAEVDMAAAELAEVERARTDLVARLAAEGGTPGAEMTLAAIAANAPEGVAMALTTYRRRLNALTAEIESTSTQIRKHLSVAMRHLDAVIGETRGTGPATYDAEGRTAAGPARPRLQRSL